MSNRDSLNASCQDRSALGESCDRVDHGFSIRGRTIAGIAEQTPGDFTIGRIIKPSVEGAQRQDVGGLGEPSAKLQDWDRGCGRPNHARAGSRRSPDFRRTGRAARGRRKVSMPASSTWTRNTVPRWATRCSGPSAATLEPSGSGESSNLDRRGQPEVPSGRSRLAGRAPSIEPSWGCLSRWRLRNRTPQRRANASASAWFRTPRRAGRSSFLRSCWKSELRRRYSQAKPGASSDRSSSYAPGSPPVGAAHRRRLHWQVADQSACRDDKRDGGSSVRPGAAMRVAAAARNGSPLVWRAPAKQMPIAVLRHPAGSLQMRVRGPVSPFGLACRIDVEDD